MNQSLHSLRFVVGPEGKVYYDPSGKAHTVKDVYISCDEIKLYVDSGKIFDALNVDVDDTFSARFKAQVERQFSSGLSLAKKAGLLFIGGQSVKDALKYHRADFVFFSENAGSDVRQKLTAYKVQSACLLHTNVYDGALGTVNTVVVALKFVHMPKPLRLAMEILIRMR